MFPKLQFLLPVARAASWSPARSQRGLHNIYFGTAGCGGKGLGPRTLAAGAFAARAAGAGASVQSPQEPLFGPEHLGGIRAQMRCNADREWVDGAGWGLFSVASTHELGRVGADGCKAERAAKQSNFPEHFLQKHVSHTDLGGKPWQGRLCPLSEPAKLSHAARVGWVATMVLPSHPTDQKVWLAAFHQEEVLENAAEKKKKKKREKKKEKSFGFQNHQASSVVCMYSL